MMDKDIKPATNSIKESGEKPEMPERRELISKLAKVAVAVPVATFLYDASKNVAQAE